MSPVVCPVVKMPSFAVCFECHGARPRQTVGPRQAQIFPKRKILRVAPVPPRVGRGAFDGACTPCRPDGRRDGRRPVFLSTRRWPVEQKALTRKRAW